MAVCFRRQYCYLKGAPGTVPHSPRIEAALRQDKAGSRHHGAVEEDKDRWPYIYTPINVNWMFFIHYIVRKCLPLFTQLSFTGF